MAFRANISAATESSGNFFHDFTKFIEEGNVLDTLVAVVIGNAFRGVTDSLANDIMSPFLLFLSGNTKIRLEDRYFVLGRPSDTHFNSMEEAEASQAIVVRYGKFIQGIMRFLLQAILIFFIIRFWTRLKNAGSRLF
jgi:large conductance mechanosensitive channel